MSLRLSWQTGWNVSIPNSRWVPGSFPMPSPCGVGGRGGLTSPPSPFCFRPLTLLWSCSEHLNSPCHASSVLPLLRLFPDSVNPCLVFSKPLIWDDAGHTWGCWCPFPSTHLTHVKCWSCVSFLKGFSCLSGPYNKYRNLHSKSIKKNKPEMILVTWKKPSTDRFLWGRWDSCVFLNLWVYCASLFCHVHWCIKKKTKKNCIRLHD